MSGTDYMKGDLKSRPLIIAKGILFPVTGLLAAAVILRQSPGWLTLTLLVITVWSFCRFYYFLFHVLEAYVDPSLRWRGLTQLAGNVIRTRKCSAHEKTTGGPKEPPAVV